MTTPADTPDFVGLTATHHGKAQLVASGASIVAPGASYSSGNLLFNKPGYIFYMTAIMASIAVNPYVMISLTWRDSATANIVGFEEWVAPAGTLATITTRGRGQTKGDEVQVKVTNLDGTVNVTIHVNLYEASYAHSRDDLRSDMDNNWETSVAATLPAPCAPLSNTLFSGIPSIPGGGSSIFILGLYAGQVNVFELDSGATPLNIIIQPTQELQTVTALTPIVEFTGAAGGSARVVALPRQPCEVIIGNPNAGPVSCILSITILEIAS